MLLALLLAAAAFQDTRAIDADVAAFTGHAIGEEGGARMPVDPRLKLAACADFSVDWQGSFQTAVVVRCTGPAWRIYVPVNHAPIARQAAAVAARPAPVAKPEPVVRRGDPVTVEAVASGFSVTREGVAMGDAAPGSRLQVRVEDKKPPIQAVAVEPGRVRLPSTAE